VRGRRALRRAPIGTGRPARARRHRRVPALHTSAPARTGGPASPIVHIFFEVRYTNPWRRRSRSYGAGPGSRLGARGRVGAPIGVPGRSAGPGQESGDGLVSRASAAKRNETRDPAQEARSAILFSPTCRRRALGPGSALAGGRSAPSLHRGARWAGTREGLLGRDGRNAAGDAQLNAAGGGWRARIRGGCGRPARAPVP
jgi:hypothetical protein